MGQIQELKNEVEMLRNDVNFLKSHFEDEILTEEENKNIEIAIEELKNNQTTSLKDLKKELAL